MSNLKVYNCHTSNAIFCTDDFYKVADVEPILNSLQQLKAEIRAFVSAVSKSKSAYETDSIVDKYCVKWHKKLSS